jgi:hypothetical protein
MSVAQLSATAHKAAQTALSQTKSLQNQKPEAGVIIDPIWIIGIIFRNADLQFLNEYQQVAAHVAPQVQKQGGIGAAPAAAAPSNAALYVSGRTILCGYRAFTEELPALE